MSFSLTVTRVLLTYSDVCGADVDDEYIEWMLESFFDAAQHATRFRLALERHTEGNYHVHLYLHYTPPLRITQASYFDIGDCHPNIAPVGCSKHDHVDVLRYLAKDGSYWGDLNESHHFSPDQVYLEAMMAESRDSAFDLIRTHRPRDLFMSHSNVMRGLDHFHPRPHRVDYVSRYTEFVNVPHVLRDFVGHMGDDGRKMGLVLFGPSRMGKTAWSRSLGRHNYFKGRFDAHTFDDTVQYHVFDDVDKFSLFRFKLWFGGDDFTIDAKYCKDVRVSGGKPCIFVCNQLPRPRDVGDGGAFDWWIRNTVRVYVCNPLY
jgi:Geminivirus rep protein central domain/Geminivirus Rep catalytic domain